ncbi:MAG TPA: hypothetical protein VKP88_03165, partial [Candidatus Paceibacterota bacterium]|nr:hypothetical protein [Candidatus Paceibacterota bacterium]
TNDSTAENVEIDGGQVLGTTATLQSGSAGGAGSDVVITTALNNTAGSIVIDQGTSCVLNNSVTAASSAGDDVTISIGVEVGSDTSVTADDVVTLSGGVSAITGGETLQVNGTTVELYTVDDSGGGYLGQLDVNATNLNLNAGTVRTSGAIDWNAAMTITPAVSPVNVTSGGGNITLVGASLEDGAATRVVNFDAGAGTLSLDTVTMTSGGSGIGVNGAGGLEFAGSIETDNGLDFSTNVSGGNTATLIGAASLQSNSGDVDFGTVNDVNINGAYTLDLTSSVGDVDVHNIGNNSRVSTLTVDAGGTFTIGGGSIFTEEANVDFSACADVEIAANLVIDTESGNDGNAGNVVFASTSAIDSAGGNSLQIDTRSTSNAFGDITVGVLGANNQLS